jgi:hypothetical protein
MWDVQERDGHCEFVTDQMPNKPLKEREMMVMMVMMMMMTTTMMMMIMPTTNIGMLIILRLRFSGVCHQVNSSRRFE